MQTVIGKSVLGRDLILHANFNLAEAAARGGDPGSGRFSLLIGGTHGDERATVAILESFVSTRLEPGLLSEPTAVLCLHNPDGFASATRHNARGVDLNRNFPHNWSPASDEPPGPAPLSEPESRALHDFILGHRPAKIVSLHWALAEIDADGYQSAALAERMWEALRNHPVNPYRLRLQQPVQSGPQRICTGSLGQWCGHGIRYDGVNQPAMVTLELPYHPHAVARPDILPEDHLESVRDWWEARTGEYLAGVQEPVFGMLEAACRFEHAWQPRGSRG